METRREGNPDASTASAALVSNILIHEQSLTQNEYNITQNMKRNSHNNEPMLFGMHSKYTEQIDSDMTRKPIVVQSDSRYCKLLFTHCLPLASCIVSILAIVISCTAIIIVTSNMNQNSPIQITYTNSSLEELIQELSPFFNISLIELRSHLLTLDVELNNINGSLDLTIANVGKLRDCVMQQDMCTIGDSPENVCATNSLLPTVGYQVTGTACSAPSEYYNTVLIYNNSTGYKCTCYITVPAQNWNCSISLWTCPLIT